MRQGRTANRRQGRTANRGEGRTTQRRKGENSSHETRENSIQQTGLNSPRKKWQKSSLQTCERGSQETGENSYQETGYNNLWETWEHSSHETEGMDPRRQGRTGRTAHRRQTRTTNKYIYCTGKNWSKEKLKKVRLSWRRVRTTHLEPGITAHSCDLYQWCTLTSEYLCEFAKKFEINLLLFSGAWRKMIHEENLKQKIS